MTATDIILFINLLFAPICVAIIMLCDNPIVSGCVITIQMTCQVIMVGAILYIIYQNYKARKDKDTQK